MTPERWQRVKAVLGAALETPPVERATFLARACGTDHELRREVESLLERAERTDGALAGPTAATAEAAARLGAALADRYTLERELGRGGMATVYLARDRRHHRPVALKVLHPDLAAVLGATRFRREIDTAANLSHPHILPLFDSGEAGTSLFYVMPYVAGVSLRERLRRVGGALPLGEALRVVREVADALDYAHRHGVVHRDIKPENVLLDEDGHALVADFGIARALHHATDVDTSTGIGDLATLTKTGMVIGTPAYMSPEQALGDSEIDGRSDVYSLACVAFELLAGAPPFHGTGAEQLGRRLTQPPPSLAAPRPDLPPAVDAVLARGLAVVRDDRYANAMTFADALADALAPVLAEAGRQDSSASRAGSRTPPAIATARIGRRRVGTRAVAGAFVLVVLSIVGVLARGSLTRAFGVGDAGSVDEPAPDAQPRVAVLPFENLGDSADAYFADGVADEVRGKLAEIHRLQVIARASSNEYRHTRKHPEQIARELGVEYLLTGTVRSMRGRGGHGGRVRVSPELVRVARARAPVTVWQHGFDAEVANVFDMQSEIAQRVAEGLEVELVPGDRARLATRPTANLAAYDAFLQGEHVSKGGIPNDPDALIEAIGYYNRAVTLDSTFARAWARLAIYRAVLAMNVPAHPAAAPARRAARGDAERALSLAPMQPEPRLAMGLYYLTLANEATHAAEQFARGLELAPDDPDLLSAATWADQALGRWDAALAHIRRGAAVNPRSVEAARWLGFTFLWLRRYPEAREAEERAVSLAPADPTSWNNRVMIELGAGDLPAARAVLARARKEISAEALAAYMARSWDVGWALDDSLQRVVLTLGPDAFGGDRLAWALALAQGHAFRGDIRAARIYADSARLAAEAARSGTADDGQMEALYAVALAYLGRREAAVRAARRSVARVPMSKDAYVGAYIQHQLARTYILFGDRDAALDALEPLLTRPYYLSPGWLRIDPNFAPLHGHPRFERLIANTP